MSGTNKRRGFRTVVAALAAGVALAGCVPGGAPRTPDDRFAGVDRPVTSPSGAFRAVLVERSDPQGTRLLVPTIRDNSGRDVFTDDPYAARHKLLVMWQASGDVLWVYSGDVGTARIGQDAGTWRKQQTRDGMPQEVRSAFGQ